MNMKAFSPTPEIEASDLQPNVNFRELIQLFLERLWLISSITLLAVTAGATYAFRSPPIYQSKVVLEVEQDEKKVINIDAVSPENLRSSEMLNTIAHTVRSATVLRRVIQKTHLTADRFFWADPSIAPTEDEVLLRFADRVYAKLRRQTRLIDLSVEHANPQMAQKLVSSIVTEYAALKMEQRVNASQLANQYLYEESDRLKTKLGRSEQAVQAYREKHKTTSMEDRQNIDNEKLRDFNQRYTQAKAARLQLEVDSQEIDRIGNQPSLLLKLQSVANHPTVLAIKAKQLEAESLIANLTQRYREKHPIMVEGRNQLAEVQESMNRAALSVVETVKSDYKSIQAREQSLKAALDDQERHSLELDKKAIEFNTLAREVESDRMMYDAVLKRLKETDVTKGIDQSSFRVVEAASLPEFPVKPQKARIILLSFIGGLVLSLGLVHLLQQLDSSLKSVDAAERVLGLPVLGAIPKHGSVKDGKGRLITVRDPDSICSEAFRTLRATLSLLGREAERKVLIFTSAVPGDGKTFCSVNLAMCLAHQGHRTLVMDFDLRKPSVAESFGFTNGGPGVSDYLLGKGQLESLIQESGHENLFVMTAGPRVPNPAELLSTKWVTQLIEEAGKSYDKIVIDTPPVNAVSDALAVMHLADTICVAARAGRTSSRAVQRAIEVLKRANTPPSGVILNCLTHRMGDGYYYSYYEKKPYGAVYGTVCAPAKAA